RLREGSDLRGDPPDDRAHEVIAARGEREPEPAAARLGCPERRAEAREGRDEQCLGLGGADLVELRSPGDKLELLEPRDRGARAVDLAVETVCRRAAEPPPDTCRQPSLRVDDLLAGGGEDERTG